MIEEEPNPFGQLKLAMLVIENGEAGFTAETEQDEDESTLEVSVLLNHSPMLLQSLWFPQLLSLYSSMLSILD